MKKYVKLLTVFLALVMILQAAPLSAMGDSTQSDTYTVTESEEDNAQASDTTDSDVAEENTATEETEATKVVQDLAWQTLEDDSISYALTDGGEIRANLVRILITLSETASDVAVAVDGVAVSAAVEEDLVKVDLELLNGSHTLTVSATEGETTSSDTISFTVNGDAAYPELTMDVPDGISLGETKTFTVSCANMTEVDAVSIRLLLTKGLKVQNVQISDGVIGSYIWFGGELEFDLRVIDAAVIANGSLVTFDVYAPVKMDTTEEVFWTTDFAEVTLKEDSTVGKTENFVGTFDTPDVSAPVAVQYIVSGWKYGVVNSRYSLTVKDADGNPAAAASIYAVNGKKDVLLGVTDENGMLVVTFADKGVQTMYAADENGLTSSLYSVTAYEPVGNTDGTPYSIQYAGLVSNGKNITWMSHYGAAIGAAKIKVATAEDMSDAVTYSGVSNYALYDTSLSINRVNEVTLTDLVPGTVYYYQVGDGNTWSDVYAFTAQADDGAVNIAILGDLRGNDTANITLLANAIKASGVDYDFAIRTGAIADDIMDYNALSLPVDALSGIGLDTIHTATDSEIASSIHNRVFATKEAFQSYVYGNVYVAVINATADASELKKVLNTIGEECKNNGSEWQILAIRDSVYSTDPENATETLETLLPHLAEIAGIDLVISGADCNFARTEALRGGEVSERNGVIYMNCGSANVKDAVANSEGFAVTSDTYHALYVSFSATEDQFTVRVYDVQPDGSSVEIDRFVRTHFVCDENDHVYRFGQHEDGLLVCEICDHTRELKDFVGLLGMSSFYMFYDNGGFYKGWKTHNGKTYYLNSLYMAVDGTQEIDGNTYVFKDYVLVEGAWVEEDGVRKLMWAGELLTNTWHTQAGVTYYFLADGAMATGTVEIPTVNEQGETVMETYTFDENGALIDSLE